MPGPVQTSAAVDTFGGASVAPSLTGTAAGNLAIITCYYSSDTQLTAPAAPAGWSTAVGPTPVTAQSGAQFHTGAVIFYKENIAGGALSATVASSGVCAMRARMTEWAYTGTSLLDVTSNASAAAPGGTSGNAGTTAATAQANELVIAVIATPQVNAGAAQAITNPPTGYTSLDISNDSTVTAAGETAYKEVSATGTQSAAWTWTGSGEWMGVIASFKGAAGGSPALMPQACY